MKTITTLTTLVASLFLSNSAFSQEPVASFTGWRVSMHSGVSRNRISLGGETIPVYNITNLTIPARGIVIVPGSMVSMGDTAITKTGLTTSLQVEYSVMIQHVLVGAEISMGKSFFNVSEAKDFSIPSSILQDVSVLSVQRSFKTKWEKTITAKLGYVHNKSLFYGRAGLSSVALELNTQDSYAPVAWNIPTGVRPVRTMGTQGTVVYTYAPVTRNEKQTHQLSAFTWALGYECMISDYFSIGAEFRHTGYGKTQFETSSVRGSQPVNASGVKEGLGAGFDASVIPVDLKQDEMSLKLVFHLQSFLKANK